MRDVDFLKTAKSKYRRYAQHVLGFRHFPEGRDGLTPVQRRSLWALYQLGATDRSKKVATSRAVGECTGRYHPHEDETVVSTMTKISQAETLAPTILGVGNWGTWEDPHAAKRYTKCYLSPYALRFFDADELSQVPMDPTYDGSDKEPRFLPAPVPHLLMHGTRGLAPGASANVPPCEPAWVIDSLAAVIEGKKVRPPKQFALRYGGVLRDLESSWLKTGKGAASFRPVIRVDEGRRAVVLNSLAPRVDPYALDEKLSAFPFYGGLSSEPSPDNEINILLLCKRGHDLAELKAAVLKLVKGSRESFSFLYIEQIDAGGEVGYNPMHSNPVAFLKWWTDWRRGVVSSAATRRIEGLQLAISRHELMIRVIGKRSELLKILDKGKSREDIRDRTALLLKCSKEEADFVLGSNLYRLASLEVSSLREKIADAKALVENNKKIAKSPDARLLEDASAAQTSLSETLAIVADIRRGELSKKRKKGRARRARG